MSHELSCAVASHQSPFDALRLLTAEIPRTVIAEINAGIAAAMNKERYSTISVKSAAHQSRGRNQTQSGQSPNANQHRSHAGKSDSNWSQTRLTRVDHR